MRRTHLLIIITGIALCVVCTAVPAGAGIKEHIEWGNKHFSSGSYDEAIESYSNALFQLKIKGLITAPDQRNIVAVTYNRGLAYLENGNYDKALEDFDMVLHQDPDDAQAWYSRGTAYERMGNTDRALSDYTAAIECDPGNALYHFSRGYLYQHDREQWDAAIADFTAAVESDPDNPLYQRLLGVAHFSAGHIGRAERRFSRAITLKKDYGEAYTGRGHCYIKEGEIYKAIPDFRKACRLGDEGGCVMARFMKDYLETGVEGGGDF